MHMGPMLITMLGPMLITMLGPMLITMSRVQRGAAAGIFRDGANDAPRLRRYLPLDGERPVPDDVQLAEHPRCLRRVS